MQRLNLMMAILLLLGGLVQAQSFQDFLNRVNSAPDTLKMAIVDSFMNAVPAFPYTEQDTLAHYLYRGSAGTVTMAGDVNGWNPNAAHLTKIPGTNLWYRTEIYEPDARLDYKYVLNGNNWILDPLNPHQIPGGFGPNSELRMPAWQFPPEIKYYSNIPHGSLFDTTMTSTVLGNTRHVQVYTPPDYASTTDSFAVVLFHDGLDYINLASVRNVLDYLIHHQLMQPVIAVFVPPVNRTPEYAGSQINQFTDFIINQVMAWVDGKYRTRRDPHYRLVMGASNGGNISLWIAQQHPEMFGLVAAQSSNVISPISDEFQNGPMLDLKIYLDIGTYDIPVLIPLVYNLRQILVNRGYPLYFQEIHEGHSWGNWRAHLDDILTWFFPGVTAIESRPAMVGRSFLLLPNYPNPFNATTIIPIRLERQARVRLEIYTVSGQLVDVAAEGDWPPGLHRVVWNARNSGRMEVASGVYLARLMVNGQFNGIQKLLLLK